MTSYLSVAFAIAVPFILWPVAFGSLFAVSGVRHGHVIGGLSGPLFFGWFLGLLVLLFPGLGVAGYSAIAILVPALLFAFVSRRRALPQETPAWELPSPLFLLPLALVAAYLFFVVLTLPARDHDILVVHSFVDSLRENWQFWSLPRYEPDAEGFYYPLSHPPAMMSFMAWIEAITPLNAVVRLPAAVALLGLAGGIFMAGTSLSKYGGVIALLLATTAPLFLKYALNTSQDVFRHAALALGLAVVAQLDSRSNILKPVLGGALLGLAAAYHSMGLLLGVGLAFSIAVVGLNERTFVKHALFFILGMLLIGAYPYWANYSTLGNLTIPTTSIVELPNVGSARAEAMAEYSATHISKAGYLSARLSLLTGRTDWGYVLIGFFSMFLPLAVLLAWKKTKIPTPWIALVLMTAGFLYLVLDPADIVKNLTGYRIQTNRRYPLAILPVAVVAAGIGWGMVLRVFKPKILVWSIVAACFVLPFTTTVFDWKLQAYAEPGQACIFCPDDQKLRGRKDSGMFRAVTWLNDQLVRPRCIAFREGAYFAWSDLYGTPYYSVRAESVIATRSGADAYRKMRENDLNCVVLDADSALAVSFLKASSGLRELREHPHVWPLSFADAEVWLLVDEPVQFGTEVRVPVKAESDRVFEIELPAHVKGELAMQPLAETPLTVVTYWDVDDRWERSVVRTRHEGPVTIPTVGTSRVRVVTSHAVSITEATFSPVLLD